MKEKPELWKRAPRLKRTVRESTLSLSSLAPFSREPMRVYAEGYPYYYLVLPLHLRISASFRCYFVFESLLPFFGSGMITAHARLSLVATPFRTLPASVMIMARSRKSEFNFPSWPDTSNGFNKWRNRVHARIKLEEIITPEFRSND